MRMFPAAIAALFLVAGAAAAKPFDKMFPEGRPGLTDEGIAALRKLDYQQGHVMVGGNLASLDVGPDFYFLNVKDARFVLETLWGNPPDESTLGMIFPASYTPLDDSSWGSEIFFEEIGYVSDDDADSYDYDDMLKQMRSDIRRENDWRKENGYEAIELVGWAAEPHYDATERELYWAKELHFGSADHNTLNYSIRVLGRRGVLNMNFIADMTALPEIETAVPKVLKMVDFTEGNRYSDFDASTDAVAAVGIGGLIAGAAVAKKAGLLAIALLVLKKAWIVLLLPLLWLKNLFTGRRQS